MVMPSFLQKLTGNYVFTIRTGLAKGMKRRIGFGFTPFKKKTSEERFLKSLRLSGKTIFDAGGYVGEHTLFFSRAAGQKGKVVVFEPNPVCLKELKANLKLNNVSNAIIVPLALGKRRILSRMFTDNSLPAYSTFSKRRAGWLSCSKQIPVNMDTLDNYSKLTGILPNFVKIDVECYEFEVLQGMKETIKACKPALFIEMHGENSMQTIEFLLANQYSIYHVERRQRINAPIDLRNGHLFCTKTN